MFLRFGRLVFAADTGGGSGPSASAPGAPAGGGAPSPASGGAASAGAPSGAGAGSASTGAGAAASAPAVFADTLPEKIRGEAAFRDIKDLDGLASSYLHATKMIGGRPQDLVKVPGPDDAAGWAEAYAKLGRPEKADGYTLTPPAGTEFSDADKAFHAAILPAIHEAGLSQRQLDRVVQAWNGYAEQIVAQQDQAVQTRQQEGERALKAEWGQAYDQNLELAKRGLAHYADADTIKYLEESRLGDHPGLVKLFAKLGGALAEDGLLGRAGAGSGGGLLAPTEARQQIAAKYADKQFAAVLTSKSAPGHAEAVAEMARLHEMAYPAAE